MAKDIFQREAAKVDGVFSSDKGKLIMDAGLGVLSQNMQMRYRQNIARLFEIGAAGAGGFNSNVYYVGGRAEGTMGLGRVIGPKNTISQFYQSYGDVCGAKNRSIKLELEESDCSSTAASQPTAFRAVSPVITEIGITLDAAEMTIREQSQMMIAALLYA